MRSVRSVTFWHLDRRTPRSASGMPGEKQLRSLTGHPGPVLCLAFWQDGLQVLASGGGSGDYLVKLWRDGSRVCTTAGHSNWVLSVAFGPGALLLQHLTIIRSIGIRDLSTGTRLFSLRGHDGKDGCLCEVELLSEFGAFHPGQDRPWDDVSAQLAVGSITCMRFRNRFRKEMHSVSCRTRFTGSARGLYTRKSGRDAVCGPTGP